MRTLWRVGKVDVSPCREGRDIARWDDCWIGAFIEEGRGRS